MNARHVISGFIALGFVLTSVSVNSRVAGFLALYGAFSIGYTLSAVTAKISKEPA